MFRLPQQISQELDAYRSIYQLVMNLSESSPQTPLLSRTHGGHGRTTLYFKLDPSWPCCFIDSGVVHLNTFEYRLRSAFCVQQIVSATSAIKEKIFTLNHALQQDQGSMHITNGKSATTIALMTLVIVTTSILRLKIVYF